MLRNLGWIPCEPDPPTVPHAGTFVAITVVIEWWAALAALAGVVIVLVVIIVASARPTDRPFQHERSALRECFHRGSLADVPLTVLLEAVQDARVTGLLTLRCDGQSTIMLFFLFGHLFHAVSDRSEGEELVLRALDCSAGSFDFHHNVRLPERESVTTPLRELLMNWGRARLVNDDAVESRTELPSPRATPAGGTIRRGSLAEVGPGSVIAGLEQERASGRLTIDGGGSEPATLHFVNGRLYHAVCDAAVGDEAVIEALSRSGGEFEFDPRAQLPADDTVVSSVAELVVRGGEIGGHPTAPRRAQHPPANPSVAPRLSNRGSLAEVPLSSVLEALSRGRTSGRLTLFDETGPLTVLYFLHGQLYHAQAGGIVGDEAVIRALGRSSGDYEFSPAAWLPEQTSVRSSIPQLIAAGAGLEPDDSE